MSEQGNEHAADAIDQDAKTQRQDMEPPESREVEGRHAKRDEASEGATEEATEGATEEATEGATEEREVESDEDRQKREEEFAREHDPANHDISAGEEFRQSGDWTAEDTGGPMVRDSEGVIVEGGPPAMAAAVSTVGTGSGQAQSGAGDAGGADENGSAGESGADDVRDGGFGWGSAAPLEDGRTPLGHPVKAWHDTQTHVLPGEDGYEGSTPDVWFTDSESAERAGFRHAH